MELQVQTVVSSATELELRSCETSRLIKVGSDQKNFGPAFSHTLYLSDIA